MNEQLHQDILLERQIAATFGVHSDVESIIAAKLPVGRSAEATLYLTKKKLLLLFVTAEAPLVLADVQKIVSRAGLKAEMYLPPKGQPHYFEAIGKEKFNEVFPGRNAISEHDIAFYKTLAPYSPALIIIREVKNGIIYRYDSDARGGWRPHSKFSYRRILTS